MSQTKRPVKVKVSVGRGSLGKNAVNKIQAKGTRIGKDGGIGGAARRLVKKVKAGK